MQFSSQLLFILIQQLLYKMEASNAVQLPSLIHNSASPYKFKPAMQCSSQPLYQAMQFSCQLIVYFT